MKGWIQLQCGAVSHPVVALSLRVGERDRSAPASDSERSIIHRAELQLSALLGLGECTHFPPLCFIDDLFAFS